VDDECLEHAGAGQPIGVSRTGNACSAPGSLLSAELFHAGTLGDGLRAAIVDCQQGYEQMIEGWNR
jgi:hypothetical protein